MLIIQALRSDRIPAAALQFVTAVLGHDFIKVGILLRPPRKVWVFVAVIC